MKKRVSWKDCLREDAALSLPDPAPISESPADTQSYLSQAYIQPESVLPPPRRIPHRTIIAAGSAAAILIITVVTALRILPGAPAPFIAGVGPGATETGEATDTMADVSTPAETVLPPTGTTEGPSGTQTETSGPETTQSVFSTTTTQAHIPVWTTEAAPEEHGPSKGNQAIAREWIKCCDSIAAMVAEHSRFQYSMTFYEGNGYAYMEVKDSILSNLQVVFEDYRTGYIYFIAHDNYSTFSPFWFEFDTSDTTGTRVLDRKLGKKGTLQDFRAAALGEIQPAKLDYASFINGRSFDMAKMYGYAFDKEQMLENMWFYTLFQFGGKDIAYFVDDRDHLREFFDLFFSLNFSKSIDSSFIYQNGGEVFHLTVSMRHPNGENNSSNQRSFYFGSYNGRYVFETHYGNAYMTKAQYEWLLNWLQPVLNQTSDFAPLNK